MFGLHGNGLASIRVLHVDNLPESWPRSWLSNEITLLNFLPFPFIRSSRKRRTTSKTLQRSCEEYRTSASVAHMQIIIILNR